MNRQTIGHVLPARVNRHRHPRRHWTAAFALAAAVVLTGCTNDPSDPGSSEPPLTPSPEASGSVTSPSPEPPESSPSAFPTAAGQWGRYASRSDACTAVAADVVAIAVLPMSLNLSGDAREIHNAEDEIAKMKQSAPEELKADFARVQLLIDTFGERVAAGERGGGEDAPVESTTEDGHGNGNDDGGNSPDADSNGGSAGLDDGNTVQSPPTAPPGDSEPEFKRDALQDALDPVKQWLTENCERSPES